MKLKASDRYHIVGRGLVFCTKIPSEDKLPKVDDEVEIEFEGSVELYKIRGVDCATHLISTSAK